MLLSSQIDTICWQLDTTSEEMQAIRWEQLLLESIYKELHLQHSSLMDIIHVQHCAQDQALAQAEPTSSCDPVVWEQPLFLEVDEELLVEAKPEEDSENLLVEGKGKALTK